MRKEQQQSSEENQEERKLTRQEVLQYRDALAVSLRAVKRKLDRLMELSQRPSHAKRTIKQRARHIQRQAAAHKQASEAQNLLEQIDLELSK